MCTLYFFRSTLTMLHAKFQLKFSAKDLVFGKLFVVIAIFRVRS